MTRARYFFAPHVHACAAEDGVIILDLKADRYIGVGPTESRLLLPVVEGWPATTLASELAALPDDRSADASTIIADMLDRGLLRKEPQCMPQFPASGIPRPESTVVHDQAMQLTLAHLRRFAIASASAKWRLRGRRFEASVQYVARRKMRAALTVNDSQWIGGLAATFVSMRPLLFTAKDACLFDSFALVNFLAAYDAFPTWVIGVKTAPFGAHSWVQHEGTVLNDTIERVSAFTPILAV